MVKVGEALGMRWRDRGREGKRLIYRSRGGGPREDERQGEDG